MKNNESLQQVRPPFTMALTAIFASLLASMTSTDHPGSPLILIPLLMILPWSPGITHPAWQPLGRCC